LLGLLVLFAIFFAIRTPILKAVFSKVQLKLSKSYALNLQAEKVGFSGFKTITFQGMKVDFDSSTILYIDTLRVNPRIFPLFAGRILFREIDVREGKFNFDIKKLRKIQKAKSAPVDTTEKTSSQANYSKFFYSIINTSFQNIPSRLKIDKFTIGYQHDTIFSNLTISKFLLKSNKFSGNALVSDNRINENILLNGNIDKSDNRISFQASNEDGKSVAIPYIGPRWNSTVTFDQIFGEFEMTRYRSGVLELKIASGINNFVINDNRIGPESVITKKGNGNFKLRISERAFEIDSTSTVSFNDFTFSPYFKFEKSPNRIVQLKVIRQEFEADKLFKSFPDGLFDIIPKLETKGNLIYTLNASLNLDYPDSATLDSRMEKKDFTILKYGGEDLRKMNGSFRHEVYERDRLVRAFTVGPENPDFTHLDQISPYLRYSILTSEDGDFYYHRGFNQDAFRESISKNWQEKRFARGGSTISMQLVKNVFLSRKKTIARKVEEMLIVWMIENLRLTSKERMFEVYLNIIEWGPNIYGAREASRFYFNKQPSQLNLKEGIFLASIVPRPKAFKYAFDTTGHLRNHYAGYYKLLSGIMLRRNQISPADTIDLKPDLELTGVAKFSVVSREVEREEPNFFLEPKRFIIELFKKDDKEEKKDLIMKK
jgi:hypothetical protein